MKLFTKVLLLLNIASLFAYLFAIGGAYIPGDKFSLFGMAGGVYPLLLLVQFLFLIIWAIIKPRYILIPILTLVCTIGHMMRIIGSKLPPGKVPDKSIQICSYNSRYFIKDVDKKHNNDRRANMDDFIKHYPHIDILCLQETSWVTRKKFEKIYPYHSYYKREGAVIFSKYPISNRGDVRQLHDNSSMAWADIMIDGAILRVYSVHMNSNDITEETNDLVEDPTVSRARLIRSARTIFGKYRQYSTQRLEQAKLLVEHIKTSAHPVLVAGDFNDSPQSYLYKYMTDHLEDHFPSHGHGLGITYGGNLPWLKIDYVFSSEELEVQAHWVGDMVISDHYPIFSQILLK